MYLTRKDDIIHTHLTTGIYYKAKNSLVNFMVFMGSVLYTKVKYFTTDSYIVVWSHLAKV